MKLKTLPIFLVFFIMGFGDAVGALVGFVTKEFSLAPAVAGLLPFFGFLAFGLFSVPLGILVDKLGQKKLLIMSLSLILAGELVPVFSTSRYEYVLAAIFFIGLGITALQVVGNPMMRDVSAEGRYSRNLTFAQFIKSIGSNTAPYIVPLVVALGFVWQGIFLIYAVVVVITLISVTMLKVKPSEKSSLQPRASIKSSFALLKRSYVLLMVLGIFFYVGAEVGVASWIAKHLQTQFNMDIEKLATISIGFFMTSLAIGRLLGSIILSYLSPKKFFVWSSVIGVLALAGIFVPVEWFVLGSIFVAGLAFANIFPLIFSILIDSIPERSNELSGLLVMAIAGGAIIPALMGVIASSSVALALTVPLLIFVYLSFLAFRSMKQKPAAVSAENIKEEIKIEA
ncbi:MAG: sugar MFS transporter [Ignavibacteria bacterium]|jgi:fucose permease|nr:sugar MFS transporter [Ignavibacteria bacterium]HEX2962451.1 MFS transporter [Ignavibacteriales bacterium]MCU7500018.1 sugar MFS transporter [Ignavibacteria bacterium]MCU7513197.1 sugar MFS transporter [Ignavibacteria bacterium]MCU7521180.1 sugar MFS transporter [Ignavibacteria bacterium]